MKVEYASAERNLREKEVYGPMATVSVTAACALPGKCCRRPAPARANASSWPRQRWNVPASECEAANSKVTHKNTGRSLEYGELAGDAGRIKLDKEPAIRTPDQFG